MRIKFNMGRYVHVTCVHNIIIITWMHFFLLQIRDEFVGDEFGEQLDTGAVNVVGKRPIQ